MYFKEGSWGFFNEIQNIVGLSLSWFNEYLTSIFQALRRKMHTAVLADGKEITINSNFSLILSINSNNLEKLLIPDEIRSLFRVVSLMEPDMEAILRAKCMTYSVKCGNILASRIKTLHDICQGCFSSIETRNQLNISTFVSILKSIYEQQKPSASDSRPNTSISANTQVKYTSIKAESKFLVQM